MMNRWPLRAGALSPAKSSSSSEVRPHPAVEWALLVGAGVLAALLHQSLRWPLQLPGHHGLEWLAILMAARLLSARPGAAFAVACGAAATALAAGDAHGTRALTYLLQGVVLDGLFVLMRGRGAWWLVALALGALVHALAPMLKNLLQLGAWPAFGALSQGLGYPLLMHAAFGAVGAFAGTLAVRAGRRPRSR